jgi:hypothetical protein
LVVGFEVPKSGDDLKDVVDGLAAPSALPQYLPVFEPGEDVFDAGPDPAVRAVVVVADDARLVPCGCGDGGDSAVAAVTEDDMLAGEQMGDRCAAVTRPAAPDRDNAAAVGADDNLSVDAAPVVFADGGDRLVVHRYRGAVNDPRVSAVVGVGRSPSASAGTR